MRILFLSTWFPYPPDNGSKIRVYHLLRALGSRHEVSLLSFAFDTARPDMADELKPWCVEVQAIRRNPFQRDRSEGALRFLSSDPIVTRPLPDMTAAVRKVSDRTAFDAVIASIEVTANYALAFPRSVVKILEEHNSLSRWMLERYQEQTAAVQRVRCRVSWIKTCRFEAKLFRQFDLCTMVSEEDRTASLTMLPGYYGPVETVPNGVDCQHNRPGAEAVMPDSLIFNGALTYRANYEAMQFFLAEVFPTVQQVVPAVTLTITGSTDGVDMAGLQLNDKVRFTGYVEDIRPFVAGSAVCIVPIKQGGGTRLKILEAMALGTPVVATTKAAEGIQAVPEEHLLLADDAKSLAENTLRLLHDPTLRRRLAHNARQLVEEQYDWQQIGQRFVALAEDLVKNRHAGVAA